MILPNKVNWSEQFKIKIANADPSFHKHEIIKLLIVVKLIHKYKHVKQYLRIYTEFPVSEGNKCDVYFENLKSKEVFIYEIQKQFSDKWLKTKKEAYDLEFPFMKSTNFIPIDLNELSDNINELDEQLERYIY